MLNRCRQDRSATFRGSLLSLAATLLLACANDLTKPASTDVPPLADQTARIHVVVDPRPEGITVTTLTIDAQALALGAYQGRFRFDPKALELLDVTMPPDNHRFVNTNGADQGEIRFAGFTVTKFESPVALVMRFRARRELRLQDLSAKLEVVGDIMGEQLEPDRILEPALRLAR